MQFTKTLSGTKPPAVFSPPLAALWYDAMGDWNAAHDLINDMEGAEVAWVHAYLHRKEGDNGNAGYWYRRAGKNPCSKALAEEWEDLVKAL
ncbi:MAG: hypothetical protein JWQ78_2120 [Sediminibacterium sp.]|nr:hypothetical protein [Sediminibacterium sp.]